MDVGVGKPAILISGATNDANRVGTRDEELPARRTQRICWLNAQTAAVYLEVQFQCKLYFALIILTVAR